MRLQPNLPNARGFTLVEAIIVIVITGIIAGMIAVFIRSPVDAYLDAARRAELTDIADTAARRIARDIRRALPNSVRNATGSTQCVEFIPTKIGARYRAAADNTGAGDILDFTTADGSFDMLWLNSAIQPPAQRIAVGDVVAIYNDNTDNGNAYNGKNAVKIAGVAEPGGTANSTAITFVAAGGVPFDRKAFPSESPTNRFFVIPGNEHVVAFDCSTGVLNRHTRILSAVWNQPANCAAMTAGSASTARLANNVVIASCSLSYNQAALSRYGIVSIALEIRDVTSGESVKLNHQVQVNNTP